MEPKSPNIMITEKSTKIFKRTGWERVSFRNKAIGNRKINFKFLYYNVEKETHYFNIDD